MMRKLTQKDKAEYIALADEFYHSSAVLHPVPQEHFELTFAELMRSEEHTVCYLLEQGGKTVGYALIAKTFSQEAGGFAWWIEELYIRPEFQGMGMGTEFFRELDELLPKSTARLRLELEPDNLRAAELYSRLGFQPLGYSQMIKELK